MSHCDCIHPRCENCHSVVHLVKEYEPLSFDIGSRFWCKEWKCTGCGAEYEMNESW